MPHHVPLDFHSGDSNTSVSCGSAFAPDHSGFLAANFGSDISAAYAGKGVDAGVDYAARCSDALQTPRIAAWLLVGAGILAGLFLLLTFTSSSRQAARALTPEQ